MATNDVKTQYENAKEDIANLLGFFECELEKQPEKIDWSHVGTLLHIRKNLIESLSFLSGFDPEGIEETLEISRL